MTKFLLKFAAISIVIGFIIIIPYGRAQQNKLKAEIAEIQTQYNKQDFEALYYHFHENARRRGLGGYRITEQGYLDLPEQRYLDHFVKRQKEQFEKLGMIKDAKFVDSVTNNKTRPIYTSLVYDIKFEKANCKVTYKYITENWESKFYEFCTSKCSN